MIKTTRFYIALAFSLFIVLYFISNPNSYWNKSIMLVNLVYILFAFILLIILYKTLKHYEKRSEFIKSKFKYVFYVTSVVTMISFGTYFTIFIENYVVPKPSHCEYTDIYGYLIEEEFVFDTCSVELIDSKFNDESQLIEMTLEYKTRVNVLNGWTLIREYEDERLIRSTYKISANFEFANPIVFPTEDMDFISLPSSTNDMERIYDYIYTDDSFSIIRTEYFLFNNLRTSKEQLGYKYEFYNDRIDKSHISSRNFLLTDEQINDPTFQESYIQFKLDSKFYKEMTRNDIIQELVDLHTFVGGGRDHYSDNIINTYLLVTDTSSDYYGYYVDNNYHSQPIYFKYLLYPFSIYGDEMIEFNFDNGYIQNITSKIYDTTHISNFEYVTNNGKVDYVDEYLDGNLVQRHVIKDLGVLIKVESYFVKNYGPGFKDETGNWGFYNHNKHPYSKRIVDFVNYEDYKFIIQPVIIKP